MYRKLALPFALTTLLLAAPAGAGSTLGDCMIGPALGSSLLIPYFEVDLTSPNGLTTIVSINNGRDNPTLVRVVLWTDWGVPTLAFDAYLVGFDVLPINLRAVFDGNVPSTGEGADLSGFPFCDLLPPSHVNPVLTELEWQQLRADHTGLQGPVFFDCAGEAYGDGIARGYITVDVIGECNGVEAAEGPAPSPAFTPADPLGWPYFPDIAIVDDRLWGDVLYVDFVGNSAQGLEAVAIWADPALFPDPDVFTFYGRYSGWDGRDDRVPLAWLWDLRFLNGGPFAGGADLIVYRDTGAPPEVADCGGTPSWRPLDNSLVTRDEEAGNRTEIPGPSFPVATQRVDVNSLAIPYPFGWAQISTSPWGSWVQPVLKAGGLFSAAYNGIAVLSTCDETPPPAAAGKRPAKRRGLGDGTRRTLEKPVSEPGQTKVSLRKPRDR